LPLDVMGSHVGPAHCHITGRTLSMAMRAGTALMGHMGLELNLLTEPEADLAELKTAIALYKAHRALLHSGDLVRLDTSDDMNVVGVVSADRAEALYSVALLTGHPATRPSRLYLTGLDHDRYYRLRLVWPVDWRSITPPSVFEALDLGGAGCVLSGEALMTAGMQLPLAFPETVLLLHLTPESSRS
jgi:alpha-galactosidase